MTDPIQQNVENPGKGNGAGSKQTQFKPGFDKRRWLNGRGKKSPEQREGDEILRAVIWEELSREFDTGTMKPLDTPETVDALRLMVRTWIKKRPETIADRIAGKVKEQIDLSNSDGSLAPPPLPDEERLARMKELAAVIAQEIKKDA